MATLVESECHGPRRETPRTGCGTLGNVEFGYRPAVNGRADPGEVVWAWIPYEEDPLQGKDRPALVIGTDGDDVLVLPMTSKDHDRDEAQEARAGRFWMDVGIGGWDTHARPSEVRLDRTVRIPAAQVRRADIALDPETFRAALAARALAEAREALDRQDLAE